MKESWVGREGWIWEESEEEMNMTKTHELPEELLQIFKKRKVWEKNLLD